MKVLHRRSGPYLRVHNCETAGGSHQSALEANIAAYSVPATVLGEFPFASSSPVACGSSTAVQHLYNISTPDDKTRPSACHTIIMRLTSKEKPDHNMVNPEKMADEHTPLISTVRTAPPRQRYPHHAVRRFCTIALSCSLIALFATFLFVFGFGGPIERHEWDFSWPDCKERHLSYEELKKILLDTPSSEKAEEWQKYYTEGAHLAGQNYSQVCYIRPRPSF